MLNKVDFPLTNAQISEFILDQGYTNYFKLQQIIAELLEAGFIREESTHNRTFYHLTEEGAETVSYFKGDISPEILKDIDAFLKEKKYELKNEVAIKTNYFPNSNGEITVILQVVEQGATLVEVSLSVPTEKEAETISNNWHKKNEAIYASLMSELL